MPTLTQEDVFTFDELSDAAKETAREDRRTGDAEDFDVTDLFHNFHEIGKILGIEFGNAERRRNRIYEAQYVYSPDIRYSGFCSQGDGASFVGSYSCAPGSPAKIREEFPAETALHEIADGLTAIQVGHRLLTGHGIEAKIECSGREVHEYAMDAEVFDVPSSVTELEVEIDAAVYEQVTELMRSFARWIYRSLEQEYDYRRSDDYIDECLSGMEFDEDGETV